MAHTANMYNPQVEAIREREFPMLRDTIYLDHAGTALYPKSLIERFASDMVCNLYGNPHSASVPSQRSTNRIDDARLRLLQLFHANPDDFDVVFVANATAGIKLVLEAFRDQPQGFSYLYHVDSHTSLVGIRECAQQHHCFASDSEVDEWIQGRSTKTPQAPAIPELFAYPAQSNMNGRRLPLEWCSRARLTGQIPNEATFTLLDAAAFVSTTPLDFRIADHAPDFTVLSLYKIFGFPDLGAVIIRKAAGHIFRHRRYFGGGTVDMVLCLKEQWHARKNDSLHDQLEDGTLPMHNIMALHAAMDVHHELFGPLERVSRHAMFLAKVLHEGLSSLRHANQSRVCHLYSPPKSYENPSAQGPIVAFNIRNSHGAWISNFEIERLASIKNIQLRTGGLCNPGGIASNLCLSPWEMKDNFSAGQRCGGEDDIFGGKPTGMIRVSLGACSTKSDVESFLGFIQEFFVDELSFSVGPASSTYRHGPKNGAFLVESLTIYPIKSCAGWKVPPGQEWEIRKEGLVWDREWCLVHQGSGVALSQKRYPKMALIRPMIDLERGCLRVRYCGEIPLSIKSPEVSVPLSADPSYFVGELPKSTSAKVCGDTVPAQRYSSNKISEFFSKVLGVDCQLARFPAAGGMSASVRHSKVHLQGISQIGSPGTPAANIGVPRPILLSNESPILVISRSSLNRLNEQIKASGGKAAEAEVFRANVVIAESLNSACGREKPYAEDEWQFVKIGEQLFELLGRCRRCQMICIDQQTAVKDEEPFVTLAKTRRFNGKVFFGQHACHVRLGDSRSRQAQYATVMVGDAVRPVCRGAEGC
ncbi:pyridoxal phosphate-dependent transferase [Phyllosticta capitalensis]|uniref:Molybdenum cofactor sulfurase n=1 Tax=Phyllosticta capitalensis TaxID=121624 RepID=A0ABR1YBH5_9PEZI